MPTFIHVFYCVQSFVCIAVNQGVVQYVWYDSLLPMQWLMVSMTTSNPCFLTAGREWIPSCVPSCDNGKRKTSTRHHVPCPYQGDYFAVFYRKRSPQTTTCKRIAPSPENAPAHCLHLAGRECLSACQISKISSSRRVKQKERSKANERLT